MHSHSRHCEERVPLVGSTLLDFTGPSHEASFDQAAGSARIKADKGPSYGTSHAGRPEERANHYPSANRAKEATPRTAAAVRGLPNVGLD